MAIQNAKNEQIVRGDNLWLFVSVSHGTDALPVAFATNCSLNRSTAMNSISSKYHGPSNYTTPGEGTWTASTEALYAIKGTRAGDAGFAELMAAMDANQTVNVKFGYVQAAGVNIVDLNEAADWTISDGWQGEGYIQTLTATGNHGDASTWTLEINGNGPLIPITNE